MDFAFFQYLYNFVTFLIVLSFELSPIPVLRTGSCPLYGHTQQWHTHARRKLQLERSRFEHKWRFIIEAKQDFVTLCYWNPSTAGYLHIYIYISIQTVYIRFK